MKLTRRKLAATVVATAVPALTQTPPPPAAPDDELQAARARMHASSAALAGQQVPMSLEPAFQFKA